MTTDSVGTTSTQVAAAPTESVEAADGSLAQPPAASRRPRIAFLSYSTGEFDSRTLRMARSAIEAGYEVIVYARWEPGTTRETRADGYRIIRVPALAMLGIPGFARHGRRRLDDMVARIENGDPLLVDGTKVKPPLDKRLHDLFPQAWWAYPIRHVIRFVGRPLRRWRTRVVLFPLRPMGWATALEQTVEPADVWHGMWAGSLPALDRLRRRFGGRTIYDSRDIYMRSRGFDNMFPGWRRALGAIERRWARRADRVLTVNDSYADILAAQFGIARPAIVRNTPGRYERPDPPPDRIRDVLGLPATTRTVLYQGGLMTERGIEQGMEAIVEVPDAVLVLMGYGNQRWAFAELAATPRYRHHVRIIDPVPPSELLDWTASADVMLMAIQPTTLNHRFTTPNKLWEAIAAGVPIVASDLPGMAEVVREVRCGVLVDPTDPRAIASGIRQILDAPAVEREAMSRRALDAAASRYNWSAQVDVLLDLYASLVPEPADRHGASLGAAAMRRR